MIFVAVGAVALFVGGFFVGVGVAILCWPDKRAVIDAVKADIHPIGRVVEQGGGYVSVFVDRDLMNYPENGTRVFVGRDTERAK